MNFHSSLLTLLQGLIAPLNPHISSQLTVLKLDTVPSSVKQQVLEEILGLGAVLGRLNKPGKRLKNPLKQMGTVVFNKRYSN